MTKSSRKYWFILVVVIALMAGSMGQALATSLLIDNSDFEALDPLSCRPARLWSCASVPDWVMSGDGGTFYADKPGEYFSLPLASQTSLASVAYTNTGSLFTNQIYYPDNTAATVTAGHLYTLTVDVGNRNNLTGFPTYGIELWGENAPLTPDTISLPNPLEGYFGTATLTYLASPGDPFLGERLGIRLVSSGAQVNWDNVTLINDIPNHITVPEPTALMLLGSGLLGAAWFGRKKFKA